MQFQVSLVNIMKMHVVVIYYSGIHKFISSLITKEHSTDGLPRVSVVKLREA